MTSKTQRGVFIIDLSPNMSVERTYKTFLHEVGHILADGETIAPSDYWQLPPDAVQVDQAASIKSIPQPLRALREERAKFLAAELEKIAETDAYDYWKWNDPTIIHSKLRALCHARKRS